VAYFWRTKQQQEIDLMEESDGQMTAFEMKRKQAKPQNKNLQTA
jgi:hypothetical protein